MTAGHPLPHPALSGFSTVVRTPVRWGEMDAFGHVNNVHFFRFFEIARIAYFDAIEFRESARIGPILAAMNCRFRRPLVYPDELCVGVRTVDVRPDRFTHEYVLVSERLNDVAAVGEGLVVSYDYELGRKAPIPADVLARIENLSNSATPPAASRPG